MDKIEVREDGKYLNNVRVYSKTEAATVLDCDKMYVSKLVDLDKVYEVGYAPYREGVETPALFVDADSVDAYKKVFRHKDDNAPHQYVIELMPEAITPVLKFLDAYINEVKVHNVEEVRKALEAFIPALKDAKDLTEARRKYAQRKHAA